ncbi:MAG TPA: CNP1-like family protein [Gammaproteobacteria bacterium]|jgi:hypothetical protein|nr:CNP1-like family protein [Gammaproteobacteria bacterium]
MKARAWLAIMLLCGLALYDMGRTQADEGSDSEQQHEEKVTLPPYPQRNDLIPFAAPSATTDFHFYIDGKSISIGRNKIIRFALDIVSDSGASNVSYEGIGCDTKNVKFYAFGDSGKWAPVRKPAWQRVHSYQKNRPEAALYDIWCNYGMPPRNAQEALQKIREFNSPFGMPGGVE